ncbi:hypothetical protein AAEX63_02010 [Luteococcus sp. H138]|uniref:hypothetical protein n=1 Tax=unclassified Luteococcus TaxID=2639923 RepID=UPI00313E61E5
MRANSARDVAEIKQAVALPLIGLIKHKHPPRPPGAAHGPLGHRGSGLNSSRIPSSEGIRRTWRRSGISTSTVVGSSLSPTPTTRPAPAARAASTPTDASSKTATRDGSRPSSCAPRR